MKRVVFLMFTLVSTFLGSDEQVCTHYISKIHEFHALQRGEEERKEWETFIRSMREELVALNATEREALASIAKSRKLKGASDPFAFDPAAFLLGLILSASKEPHLIAEILSSDPPQTVGFQSLADFMEGLDGDTLVLILHRAMKHSDTPWSWHTILSR